MPDYRQGNNPANASDSPFYQSWLGLSTDWTCNDWKQWYYALEAVNGQKVAHDTWLAEWDRQSYWSYNKSWCSYGADFNAFIKDRQLDISSIVADIFVVGERVLSTTIDSLGNTITVLIDSLGNIITKTVDQTGKVISTTLTAANNTLKTISWVAPLALTAAVALALSIAFSVAKQKTGTA